MFFTGCGGKVGTDGTGVPPVAQGGDSPSGGTGGAPIGGSSVPPAHFEFPDCAGAAADVLDALEAAVPEVIERPARESEQRDVVERLDVHV